MFDDVQTSNLSFTKENNSRHSEAKTKSSTIIPFSFPAVFKRKITLVTAILNLIHLLDFIKHLISQNVLPDEATQPS